MNVLYPKRRRSLRRRIAVLPLLPALMVMWMIGWTLTQIGSSSNESYPKNKKAIAKNKKAIILVVEKQ